MGRNEAAISDVSNGIPESEEAREKFEGGFEAASGIFSSAQYHEFCGILYRLLKDKDRAFEIINAGFKLNIQPIEKAGQEQRMAELFRDLGNFEEMCIHRNACLGFLREAHCTKRFAFIEQAFPKRT